MTFPSAHEHRRKVEEFQKRHRVGLLTLLFTDIVGSTQLKQDLGDLAAVELIHQHHALVRELLAGFAHAEEIGTAGDSFFIIFTKPSDAARFSLLLQAGLRSLGSANAHSVADRIGIHVGEVVIEEKAGQIHDLYGMQVDTAARVMSLAEGGQILLTRSAFDNARQIIKGQDIHGVEKLTWLNYGPYLVKGVEDPIEVCEVGEEDFAPLTAPKDLEKARRQVSPDSEPVLGWRPSIGQIVPNTKWVLEKQLGEGGFGEVWLANHETLGERRVFKFCFRADRVRSLKRELTLFKLLKEKVGNHPNIVGVQDVFLDSPPFYLVMDYAQAEDLRTWCDALGGVEKISLSERLDIVAQVCDALLAAHSAGILHRDIKPSNILVGRDRDGKLHARLTDFGIGKIVSQEALSSSLALGFTETMMGIASTTQSGSRMYMAPELLAGKPASAPSDIYSLGVVLYQLVVGDFFRPVTTDWAEEVEDSLLRSDLKRCFAGHPEQRFASAGELASQLRRLPERRLEWNRNQADLAARERMAYRRGIIRAAGLAAVVIALVAGLALVAWKNSKAAQKLAALNEKTAAENLRIAAQSQDRLADQYVAKAAELMDRRDFSGALLWSVQALKLAGPEPARQRPHRARIGVLLREMPALQQMLFAGAPVSGVGFAEGGDLAVGISPNGREEDRFPMVVSFWNWKTGMVHSEAGTSSNVWKLETRGGRVTGLSGDENSLIDLCTRTRVSPVLNSSPSELKAVSWSLGGKRALAIGLRDDAFDLWDLNLKRSIQSANMSAPIQTVAVSEESDSFALGYFNGAVGIYRAGDADAKAVEFNQGGEVTSMEFSPSGLRLLTLTRNGTIQVNELDGLSSPRIQMDAAIAIRFAGSEDEIGAGTETGFAAVWDRATADPLTPLLRHGGPVRSLDFSLDANLLATASDDGIVRIWNLEAPRQTRRRFKTAEEAQGIEFKRAVAELEQVDINRTLWRKGTKVEVRSVDLRHVQMFDSANTNQAISTPVGLSSRVIKVAVSEEEGWIGLAGINRTVRVWDWRKGQPVTPELKIREEIVGLEFVSDNSALFVQLQDGGGETISLKANDEPTETLLTIAELYAGETVNTNIGLTSLTSAGFQARWKTFRPTEAPDAVIARTLQWREKEALEFENHELFAQALPHLNSLRLARPNDPAIALRRGWCLAELDRLAEAGKEFLDLPGLGSRPGQTLPLAALCCLRQGKNARFHEIMDRLLAAVRAGHLNDFETALAVWTACLGLRDQGKAEAWLSVAKAVAARHPDDSRIGSAVGFAEFRTGNPQTAFEILEKWIKKMTLTESIQLAWIQSMAQFQLKNTVLAQDKKDYITAFRPSRGSWDYASELQIMLEEMQQTTPEKEPF